MGMGQPQASKFSSCPPSFSLFSFLINERSMCVLGERKDKDGEVLGFHAPGPRS